ncbi:MAG: hypothetical protein HQL42_14220 [Alphaproteobacteria bacterium]|nr:hypothetical protein [Alphaproteobacteria bacterium]
MIRFKPWEEEPEDLELRWLGGFRNDADMGWQVRVISRRLGTPSLRYDWVPIGLLPVTPGHVVSGGEVLSTVLTGVPLKFDIPDLSKGLDRDAANVPPELYSFDHKWGWGQRVLRYHVGDEVCLIPTIELVRHLFLLNKRLAWAIMDPVGLGNLMVPVMPGLYTDLHIDFTENIPLKCLGKLEALEFAWLAVHPEGRRCWDSVRRCSLHRPYISLEPPPIEAHIEFRGVKLGKQYLVLEIEKLFGRTLPCDRLTYSHPADRHNVHDATADDAERTHKRAPKADASSVGEGMPEIDPRLGSRRNQHQKALPLVERFSTFDRDIPVDRVKVPKVVAARDKPAQGAHTGAAKRRAASAPPVQAPVSLNPEVSQDGLPPIDFKHLERADDYVGETAWLAAVVRRIAVLRPHIQISMSHFFLRKGREFTKTSRGRRAFLVALFQFPDRPPAVLIDVDHTGLRGLAAMMLRYTTECPFAEMESHIKTLLDALVDNSGKWDRKAEADLPSFVTCKRQKKVLRRQGERTSDEMLSVWTDRLLNRLVA